VSPTNLSGDVHLKWPDVLSPPERLACEPPHNPIWTGQPVYYPLHAQKMLWESDSGSRSNTLWILGSGPFLMKYHRPSFPPPSVELHHPLLTVLDLLPVQRRKTARASKATGEGELLYNLCLEYCTLPFPIRQSLPGQSRPYWHCEARL